MAPAFVFTQVRDLRCEPESQSLRNLAARRIERTESNFHSVARNDLHEGTSCRDRDPHRDGVSVVEGHSKQRTRERLLDCAGDALRRDHRPAELPIP